MKNRLRSRAFVFPVLTVVCIAVLLLALWKQKTDLSRIKRDYSLLQKERGQLQQYLTSASAESGRSAAVPAQAQTQAPKGGQDHSQDDSTLQLTALQPSALHPTAHPPEPEPNRLALAGTEVHPIAGGLVTTMRFTPRKTGPLGLVALAIRMPKNVETRILDLAPVGPATYSDDSKTVSEDGKFAFFQGTLGEETNVQFALSVSGPATADVRGTRGIGVFQLEIQPTGANVRGK